jgi:prepilin peptidase CpaA
MTTLTAYAGLAPLAAGLIAASVWDIKWRRIPNWLNLTLALGGIAFGLMVGGPAAMGWSVLGLLSGLGLLLLPHLKGWIGAGDVKLLAAVGAWLGPVGTVHCALAGAVFGGLLALAFLVKAESRHRRCILTNLKLTLYLRTIPEIEHRPAQLHPPYGLAISAGALVAVFTHGGLSVGIGIS